MDGDYPIRHFSPQFPGVGICILLALSVQALVSAQTSPTAPTAPQTSSSSPSSTSHPAKKKPLHHAASGTTNSHATGKRTSIKGTSTRKGTSSRKKVVTKRGQQGIDSDRTREIQTALIRQNYMQGEPSGSWDDATQAAMRRFQADHGWQSKTIPDSRALIRLGLGPSSDHLLNPESAMTTAPNTAAPPAGGANSDEKSAPPQNTQPQ